MKRIPIALFTVFIFTVVGCGNYIGDALNPSVSYFSTSSNTFTTGRLNHQSIVYNGYLYIIGGYNPDVNFLNDIYSMRRYVPMAASMSLLPLPIPLPVFAPDTAALSIMATSM